MANYRNSRRRNPSGNGEPSQGTSNNLAGMALANRILAACQKNGFSAISRHNAPGWGLGGKGTQIPVWVEGGGKIFPRGLGIDTCGQDAKGTGANKIPSKIWTIVESWKAPGVLILEGSGRDLLVIRDWAKSQVGRSWHASANNANLLGVFFSVEEFEEWLVQVKRTGKPPKPSQAEPPSAAMQASLF